MDTDAPPPPKKTTSRWKRWLKRLSLGLLALFLLLAVFHRPLIFEGTRYFVVRAAKQQNLDIDYKIEGSIFSTLTIKELKGTPTEPGPIQRLEIGTIDLKYSLWGLIRKGIPALLQTVVVKDVFVEITPGEPPPPPKQEEPQALKFPALFPETLMIENINFLSHAPTGDTALAGLYFTLLPDRPGVFKIQTLDIPGVRRWEGIAGNTTFRDRNLLLTDLVIGPEIALRKFNLDASKLGEAELGLALDGTFFGGATTLQASIADLNATNRMNVTADIVGISFTSVSDYLNLNLPVRGELQRFHLVFTGEPEKPVGWAGEIGVDLGGIELSPLKVASIKLETRLGEGKATVTTEILPDDRNSIRLNADAALPEKLDGFAKTTITGHLDAALPELGLLTATLPQVVTGDANLGADFRMEAGRLTADAVLKSALIAAATVEIKQTEFTIHAEKNLEATGPAFRELTTRLDGGIASLRFGDYTADAFLLKLATTDDAVKLEELSLKKVGNTVFVKADYTLPEDMTSFQKQPLMASLKVDAPELQAFLAPDSATTLRGRFLMVGDVAAQDGVCDADLTLEGREIESVGLTVRTLDGRIVVTKNQARLDPFTIVLNDRNRISAQFDGGLTDPYAYKGSLDVQLQDLAVFQPLLGEGPNAPVLGGALTVSWQGQGEALKQNTGSAKIELTNGRFGDQRNLTAFLSATYTPETIAIPEIRASSDLASLGLALNWQDKKLNLTNLIVRQQRLTVLTGSGEIPLDLAQVQNPNALIPNDQPLRLTLRTDNLDLRTLLTQLGQRPPPVTGTVNLAVNAEGTLNELLANVSLRANRLQSTAAANFAPADIVFDANLRDDRLALDGTVRQRLIQPLRITGSIPLDVAKIRESQAIDPNTPLSVDVNLPRSSLAFLSTLVPAIRQSRGDAEIALRIRGTMAKPDLSGSVQANLSTLRFADQSLPPVGNFGLGISFTGDRLTINRCRGGLAGGFFEVGGGVNFASLNNPILDLRLQTRNALVLQNDDVTARVSSDVRVTGPMNAGSVTGTVWVTRSRFFRNIDILPIGLPGRPAPQPRAEPAVISFPNPPLRDWKFDVAIKTADPFLVQGNLANGRIILDLRLGGTGRDPWMDGSVLIEQLTASLPFSRLEIGSSKVHFQRDQPFVPMLDIRGTSTIREYDVGVTIYGSAYDPQAIFTSDPPLPQAEIVSLIATGMTTQQLSSDPNALAGRAAFLVLQKAYNNIFRRNKPPSNNDSFLSRIQFDVGVTDPKTGKQSTSIRIPLSDQFMLTGGLDVGGNFRGQVKYLLRFQ